MSNYIALRTILGKEIFRFIRIWPQTLLPAVVSTSLYFLIFGALIGSRVGEMHGVPYMNYIVPGVVLMSVINNAYANVVASFYSTKFQRYVEELLIAPVPPWVIILGYVGGGAMRGLLVGALVAAISLCFSQPAIHDPGVLLSMFFLTALLFSLAGLINAVYANSFDDISIVPNFVLTPLVYLGGVFYSIDLLAEPWRSIALANPILYMVNAFRYGFLGVSDVPLLHAFAIVTGVILLMTIWAWILLARGVGLKQ